MASDGFLALYFILLILFGITTAMADKEQKSFPPTTSGDGALKRNSMEFTTTRHAIGNSNSDSTRGSESKTKAVHPPPPGRRVSFRVRQTTLPWQERMFSVSAHEVPSGPNPISNSFVE